MDDDDGGNPFSFSMFLKKKEQGDGDEEDIVAAKDTERSNDSFENFTKFSTESKSAQLNNKRLLIIEDDGEGEEESRGKSTPQEINKSYSDSGDSFDSVSASPQAESYMLQEAYSATDQYQLITKVTDLTEENENLQLELNQLKEEFLQYRVNANKRISNLQRELEKSRLKEADETRAMEDVARMVEQNLEKTTTRALKAEATVTRLKEEIKFLKEEHVPASQYNRLLEEHNHLVHTINEKSMHAASLMRSAAEKTEPYLRQLQSGVSSLYFLAEQFDDITKIADLSIEHTKQKHVDSVT